MKKIAIAVHNLRLHTGRTAIVLEHTRRFRACGYEVHLFGERLDAEAVKNAGGRPHAMGKWPLPMGKYVRRYIFSRRLTRRLQASYDVVMGHGELLQQDILSLHLIEELHHELQYQTPMPRLCQMARYQRRLLSRGAFKVCIANSNLMSDYLQRHFNLPAARLRVIYPGYDPQRFNPAAMQRHRLVSRQRLGIAAETCVIGLITSGAFAKRGLDLLLHALAQRDGDTPPIKLLVVGKDSHRQRYVDLTRALGLGEHVIYRTSETQVETYYAALDLFVYPSHAETFSLVVQEAMACGLPILMSTRIGARELFDPHMNIPFIEHMDAGAIAAKLALVLKNQSLRQRMAAAALAAAKKNSWDIHFQRLLEVCREYSLL
jgi:UDP-glucose:(heptosyl)LPS alpha-1,3-glucosyltransferase